MDIHRSLYLAIHWPGNRMKFYARIAVIFATEIMLFFDRAFLQIYLNHVGQGGLILLCITHTYLDNMRYTYNIRILR